MNKLFFTKFMLILSVMFLPFYVLGQSEEVEEKNSFKESIYVTGDVGLGILDGDNTKMKIGMNGHVGLGYQFDKYIGIKGNFGYGTLNGGFTNITIDKLNYFEANINLMLDLTSIIWGYNPERKFSVIPHVGLGQIQYRINALNSDGSVFYRAGYRDDSQNTDGGINGRKIVATLPMGVELNYLINPNWKIYLDLNANYTDTDLLEGVNGNYRNDWFYAFNLGASYKLFNGGLGSLFRTSENYCNYWYATLDGGASFLFGDNKFSFSIMKPNVNLGVGYNFHNLYRIYAKVGKGGYTGQKDGEWVITDGNYLNASLNISADIIGLIFGYNPDRHVTLYPHVGIGQTQYRVTTYKHNVGTTQIGYNNDNKYNQKGDGINHRRVAFTFPLGAELVYNVNEKTDIYADATSYLTQTDLLDGIVNGNSNDSYTTVNIGLRYKFNRHCTLPQEDKCLTPDEVKEAIKEAVQEQKAEEEAQEEPQVCITPEDLKQAIKEAIEEYEASKPKENNDVLSHATVINNNFSDISFPQNTAQKVKTQTNIDAINRASNQVDNGSAVNRVIIEGYASPEGSNEFNERLALERAEEAAVLIKKELGDIESERIEITNKGADWDGLYKALEASDIENSEEIINELKNSSNPEETLRELLKEYPQIRNLLPQLRRASVVITTVK